MADTKTSDLTALTGANVAQTADVIPIVDTDATTTKKILVSELAKALKVLGTEQASTSGTEIDFTSIPAWVKRITVMFVGVSTNGTSNLQIQLGDAGGFETTGYTSNAFGANNSTVIGTTAAAITTGLLLMSTNAAAATWYGAVTLTMEDESGFDWVSHGGLTRGDTGTAFSCSGHKALSAALTQVRITTVNGTDAFDAGAINILYE